MSEITAKFWFIDDIQTLLMDWGLSYQWTSLVVFIVAVVLLFLLLCMLDLLVTKVLIKWLHYVVKRAAERSQVNWFDAMVSRRFFRRLFRLIVLSFITSVIDDVLLGFSPGVIKGVVLAMRCIVVFYIMPTFGSLLDAFSDIYMMIPRNRQKSIKSYMQSLKILIDIICVLMIISLLAGVSLTTIAVSLATSAAILTLVFKDTILGFVASIQLSAQDMVRIGDWVEMKSKGADGVVIDVTVNTVKVRNWDNTVTMIPIYSMVSESFINWRSMEESEGRRFKRVFAIDLLSIRVLEESEFEALGKDPLVSAHFDTLLKYRNEHPEQELTNTTLYRVYVSAYLRNNKNVNDNLSLVVHYVQMSDQGLPLEIYGFTYERGFEKHEIIVAQITEHILNVARVMGIRFFQRSTNVPAENNG